MNFPPWDEFKPGLNGCLEEIEQSDRKLEWMALKFPSSPRLLTPSASHFQEASLSVNSYSHSSRSCLKTISKLVDYAWANAFVAALIVYLLLL